MKEYVCIFIYLKIVPRNFHIFYSRIKIPEGMSIFGLLTRTRTNALASISIPLPASRDLNRFALLSFHERSFPRLLSVHTGMI